MIAAVVPVKRLDAAKSRLAAALGREEARRLALAMLLDVLAPLRESGRLSPVVVVTEDPEAAEAARSAGVRALQRPDPGLNAAIDGAARELSDEGAEGLLVVLGDVAGLTRSDVDALFDALAALGGRGVVLAPARDGGTAALLRVPCDAIPARFGPASADAHRDAARDAGVPWREVESPGLSIDLDEPADLRAFLAGEGAGPRTRSHLRALGWSAAC